MRGLSLSVLGLALLTGCSSGLQEVGFAIADSKDGVHHIVTRDVVSSRISANQPHTAGQFHCTGKYTSVEMASLRAQYGEHTWYKGCQPTSQFTQHQYVLTSDQSIGSLLQGPVSAAILGGSLVGMAALWPEDNMTQNGGGANSSSNSAAGASSSSYSKAYGGSGGSVNIRSKHGRW